MKAPNSKVSRNRMHYNSEPSTLKMLNNEINKNAREEQFYKNSLERLASLPEEVKSKHTDLETKKVTAQALADKKIAVMESKMSDIAKKILAFAEKNPNVDPFVKFESVLAKFKKIDDEQIELKRSASLSYKSYYTDLLVMIAQENAHTLIYAPADLLTRCGTTISLKDLDNDELSILQSKIEAMPQIFYNEHFKQIYLKHFPDYIGRMTSASDIVYALGNKPSAYLNAPASFITTLYQSPTLFKNVANRAPSALKYMSKQDLYYFGSIHTSSMGVAIVKDPDILNNISDDFFTNNAPKFIFTTYNKSKVLEAIKSHLDRFPTLARWLNYTIDQPTYVNGQIVDKKSNNNFNATI